MSRRRLLGVASGIGVAASSGCLRLTGGTGTETPTGADSTPSPSPGDGDPGRASPSGGPTPSPGGGTVYSVERFTLGNFDSQGALYEPNALDVRANDERTSIDGSWDGDTRIFSRQACANYAFELLEGDDVVARSGEKTLIVAYQYVMEQSADALFVTYHPSVGREWHHRLKLSYTGTERTVTPTVRPEDGVFEVAFSDIDVDPGRYNWLLEITPTDGTRRTGFTIEIGKFDDRLAHVSPEDASAFPDREEAMRRAAMVSNRSATAVDPPETGGGDGLAIVESGHGGGSTGDTDGRFITRDVNVECRSVCEFGGDSGRRYRIACSTSDTSLSFTPGA